MFLVWIHHYLARCISFIKTKLIAFWLFYLSSITLCRDGGRFHPWEKPRWSVACSWWHLLPLPGPAGPGRSKSCLSCNNRGDLLRMIKTNHPRCNKDQVEAIFHRWVSDEYWLLDSFRSHYVLIPECLFCCCYYEKRCLRLALQFCLISTEVYHHYCLTNIKWCSVTGLILHKGNKGYCLHAPWSLPWSPWNAISRNLPFSSKGALYTKEKMPWRPCPL